MLYKAIEIFKKKEQILSNLNRKMKLLLEKSCCEEFEKKFYIHYYKINNIKLLCKYLIEFNALLNETEQEILLFIYLENTVRDIAKYLKISERHCFRKLRKIKSNFNLFIGDFNLCEEYI